MSGPQTHAHGDVDADASGGADRWDARPVLAGIVRGAIAVVPILAAVATTSILVRLTPSPTGAAGLVATAVAILGASTLVLVLTERVSRRFLPLALLLRMSLLFPDKAPPRYRIARRAASVRQLEERVERAREVGRVNEPMRVAEDILTLIAGLTRHDKKTRGHSERVRVYTDLLTERLGLNHGERERLRWASLIHDIGKLEVPSKVLNKPGRPSESEWEQLKAHPAEGARIAAALLPWLGEWGKAIEHHHERWDGGGYPNALAGTQISMAGRIVSVADSYETMTAVRSYKSAMSHVAAREEVARCAGSQFDPHVVRAFLDIPLTQLVRVAGPISWLIQLPVLRHLQPAASQLVPGLAASGANVATAAVLGTAAVAATVNATPDAAPPARASTAAVVLQSSTPAGPDDSVGVEPRATARPSPAGSPTSEDVAPAAGAAPPSTSVGDERPATPVSPSTRLDGGRAGGATGDEPTGDPSGPPLVDAIDPAVDAAGPIVDVAEDAVDAISDTIEEAIEDTVDVVAPVRETTEEVIETITGSVESTVEAVTDTVTGTVTSPSPTTAPVPDPVEIVDEVVDLITDPASAPTAPTLPSLPVPDPLPIPGL